jgi:FtsP/CotA-like multicopper oxidase with cupredoxin domain
MRHVLVAALLCCASVGHAVAQAPRLVTNDNRHAAGTLKNGVLQLEMELTTAMWHPDRDEDPGIEVMAFAESGKAALLPAPLIRVPRGTVVRTRLRNTLSESMVVYGLHTSHAMADTVRLEPGETRELTLSAGAPGNFTYGAFRQFRVASPENPTSGSDMPTSGAFVVDEAGARATDRVFVINMMVRAIRAPSRAGRTNIIATLNGRAWPNNERPVHNVGDTVTWRVINASLIPHPMHLHGFYFDVLSRMHPAVAEDSIFTAQQVRKAVTERLEPFGTMTIRWVPERAGNWLFHCHLPVHTALRAPFGEMKASAEKHVHDAVHGMQNLMMGVQVNGPAPRDVADRRHLRLLVEGGDSLPGDLGPRYRYLLDGRPNPKAAGPVIVLQQNQPTAITVVNRTREPTAVHWHGIELESFNDGVAGFGGFGGRITPLIAAGDSFVARMTPPRTGTFIYHTHVDELRQMGGGLYGTLLVVPPGGRYDENNERVVLLGSASDTAAILFNGEYQPDMQLKAGQTYKLRFVHIMIARPAMFALLVGPDGKPEQWTLVAKDGADLPAHQRKLAAARQPMANGETYDFLFTPRAPGTWRLETRAGNGNLFGHMTITAR